MSNASENTADGGWRIRGDQVVALGIDTTPAFGSDAPPLAITARVVYDPEAEYVLARVTDEDLAHRCLDNLVQRLADEDRGPGTLRINRRTGTVAIARAKHRSPSANRGDISSP